jgi:hypothetical protein
VKLTRHRPDEPVLITRAEPSQEEQFLARRRKYVIMMSIRVVCLVLAAAFYHIRILLVLFALAAVALPWMAVIIANDRPAKRAWSVNFFRGRRTERHLERVSRPELPVKAGDSRVVDAEDAEDQR